MEKINKLFIIGSILLIFTGCILFVVALSKNNWNLELFSTGSKVVNSYEINDEFENILIDDSVSNIKIEYIEDDKNKVVIEEVSNRLHTVEVIDNSLTINENDKRVWYEKLFNFERTLITIYLNKSRINNLTINSSTSDIKLCNLKFTDIKIYISTGDIKIKDINSKNIDLKVSTGDIYLENIECEALSSEGSTGDIKLKNTLVLGVLNIIRDTGDVTFEKSDAYSINIKTSTGDVTGTLLTRKCFIVKTSTGKKQVPETLSGGKCEITTSTGDVIIDIEN